MESHVVNLNSPHIRLYIEAGQHPTLSIPQHVIYETVQSFAHAGDRIGALRLIRGAFNVDGSFCSLQEARWLYAMIIGQMAPADIIVVDEVQSPA